MKPNLINWGVSVHHSHRDPTQAYSSHNMSMCEWHTQLHSYVGRHIHIQLCQCSLLHFTCQGYTLRGLQLHVIPIITVVMVVILYNQLFHDRSFALADFIYMVRYMCHKHLCVWRLKSKKWWEEYMKEFQGTPYECCKGYCAHWKEARGNTELGLSSTMLYCLPCHSTLDHKIANTCIHWWQVRSMVRNRKEWQLKRTLLCSRHLHHTCHLHLCAKST